MLETDTFLVHCDQPSPAEGDLCAGEWAETRVTPQSFDMRQAPVAVGYFLGDYIGLTGTDAFVAFFAQTNSTADRPPSTPVSSAHSHSLTGWTKRRPRLAELLRSPRPNGHRIEEPAPRYALAAGFRVPCQGAARRRVKCIAGRRVDRHGHEPAAGCAITLRPC